MNVLIIGNTEDAERFQRKFGNTHGLTHSEVPDIQGDFDAIFWFNANEYDASFIADLPASNVPVFINAAHTTLADLEFLYGPFPVPVFGFCGYNTFMERELFEVSLHKVDEAEVMKSILSGLGTEYEVVEDRIGMVSPRTIFMIINEAYFTVMEGTASKEGVDNAMKLGTNYPYGPFEWAQKIGLNHVYEVIESMQLNLGDARYRACELLKKEYMQLNS